MSSWKKAFKDTVTLKKFQPLAKAIYHLVLIALGYMLGLYQSLKRKLSRLLKKAKKQWRSKRSVRLSALFLSLAILLLSVRTNKDKIVNWGLFLKSSLNNKLEQSWKPKIHDLLTSVVLRNNADENSLSVVAVYVLQSNQSSFEDLKNSSYEKSLIPTGRSFAFIGSGAFVRQSLFNKKSNLVLSAAHVCIVGAGFRNIAKYKEEKEGFVSTEETQGLFLGLKTKDGSTYRVKKMYLDVKSDICPFKVKVVDVESSFEGYVNTKDAMAIKRAHFLYNDNIAKLIAETVYHNIIKDDKKRSALVLVNETRQIYLLYHALNSIMSGTGKSVFDVVAVATATTNKESVVRAMMPDETRKRLSRKKGSALISVVKDSNLLSEEEWKFVDFVEKSDIESAVEDFNLGKKRVLIGTTAISTGVNIFPTHFTFNWQGGSSEIACKQGAIGRSVRRLELSKYKDYHDPKPFSLIIDFNVLNQPVLYSMLKKRLQYYEE